MHSIRTKITLLTVCAIVASMTIATLLGVLAVNSIGNASASEQLSLLCETGEKNLDSYFESVEQSVEMLSMLIEQDLESVDKSHLHEHIARVSVYFENTAKKTNGALTYYYRIDPAYSETEKGFWFIDLNGNGFKAHTVTDISKFDTEDTSKLTWFTIPKKTGHAIWVPPYFTDGLDNVLVFSYNAPIYQNEQFVGVVGIEIDYGVIFEQVNNITLYENGYAFINDAEGNIICHPKMSWEVLTGKEKPKVPDGLLSESSSIRYSFEGVEKEACWMPLSNGMRLNVTVPVNEINGNWVELVGGILIVSAVLLIVFVLITMRVAGHITKPLRELTSVAAKVNEGNYDVRYDYDKDDEIGLLSRAFNGLIGHLKVYIGDLNNLVYADALTSIHNKGAFDIYVRELQTKLEEEPQEFAVGIFDCDNLKQINDKYGHYSGDIYIKSASHFICRIFPHSPVFRIGGDEFAVILQGEDFRSREEIMQKTGSRNCELNIVADGKQVRVSVSMGVASFDPAIDKTVDDVIRRADKLMYENKREHKTEAPR